MFKKLITITISFIILISFYTVNKFPIFSSFSNTFEVYLSDYSDSSAQVNVNLIEFIFLDNVKGESFVVNTNKFELNDFLSQMNAKIIFESITDNVKSFYCFSNSIKYCQVVNGRKINLHIAVRDEQVKVGSPIIYGSF